MQQRARKLRAAASLPSTPAPAVPVGGMRALTLEPPRCSTSVGKRQGSGGAAGAPAADAGHARADGGESRSGSVPRSMSSGSLQGARRCAADAA